jgi:hypothetical protein
MKWQNLILPEGGASIAALEIIASSNLDIDFARGVGGNVMVLNVDVGNRLSYIHRLDIKPSDLESKSIENQATLFATDRRLALVPTAFLQFGRSLSQFFNDGALIVIGAGSIENNNVISLLSPGFSMLPNAPYLGFLTASLITFESKNNITRLIKRAFSLGNYMIISANQLVINA